MKKGIFSRWGFVTMIVVIFLTMPTVALSLTFTTIKTDSFETSELHESDVMTWLGFIGPGGGSVDFLGDGVLAIAAASSLNSLDWFEVWAYWSTNSSYDLWTWLAIYRLSGDPGLSANISLDYTYRNQTFNAVALAARTKSESSVGISWDIVPASMSEEVNKNMLVRWMLDLLNIFHHEYEYESLSYNKEYGFAALTWADDTETGSIPLGSMEVGDYLFLVGQLEAQTEAQVYAVSGASFASMVSSFRSDLVINEIPPTQPAGVPEPATMLLLGSGLIGLAGYGRKKFFKK